MVIVLLFILLQPLYSTGGHMYLGGLIVPLLGSLGCVSGLLIVLYFLFRASPDEGSL
jgi:hypothetical protein